MKIAVTGAAGRLGSAVCRELLEVGHEVIAVDVVAGQDPGVALNRVDLLDGPAVRAALAGAEVVVHLANHTTHLRRPASVVYLENVTMNFNIARFAAETGVRRIIFASSVQVCSGESEVGDHLQAQANRPAYLPADGGLPANPRNAYSLSKESGEQVLRYLDRTHGISSVAIRYPLLLNKLDSRPSDFYNPHECFTWLTYQDGARLVAAILRRELPGFRIYFPASAQPINRLPLEENLRRYYEEIPLRVPREKMTGLHDNSVITQETGWVPN